MKPTIIKIKELNYSDQDTIELDGYEELMKIMELMNITILFEDKDSFYAVCSEVIYWCKK